MKKAARQVQAKEASCTSSALAPDAPAANSVAANDSASARASTSTSAAGAVTGNFRAPADVPTQQGSASAAGVRYDFNDGCRILLPARADGEAWHVRIADAVTGNTLFETSLKAGVVASSKKYFVPFEIDVRAGGTETLRHRLDFSGKKVLIQFPVGTLGDLLGWFPYAAKFAAQHPDCQVSCAMGEPIIALVKNRYPAITFVTPDAVQPEQFYATYNIGLFFTDEASMHQPCDFRHVGLHRTAGYILGVDPEETPPLIDLPGEAGYASNIGHPGNARSARPIAEKYVCIAAQSTTQCKYWNNPSGWRELVQFLNAHGYRVICIDQKATHGAGTVWNHIPYGSEDQTGEKPLAERARWLRHADFFVGLSSGLSWLAWAVGTPVVMISGFTHPTNEFHTPYRVINYHTCNSCWNDVRVTFDHKDFLWCPRHANTPRQFECTRLITTAQVVNTICRIPGFAA